MTSSYFPIFLLCSSLQPIILYRLPARQAAPRTEPSPIRQSIKRAQYLAASAGHSPGPSYRQYLTYSSASPQVRFWKAERMTILPQAKKRRSETDFETPNNNPEASGFGVERRNKRRGTNVNRHSPSAVPVDAVERSLLRRGAGGGDRTRTRLRGILSPLCLPIPPHRRVPMLSPAARRVKPRESS